MRTTVPTMLAILGLCLARFASAAPPEDAHALVKRVSDTRPKNAYTSRMTLTTPGGLERELTLSGKDLGNGVDARYLEVTGPANLKDTRYLFYDRNERRDEQYMWLPFMRRVMRLSEKTRHEPFLGSTFYLNDIIAPAVEDYTYRFVGDAVVQQRQCRLVESVPKDPGRELYSRSIVAIDPVDLVVVRAQLFDKSGKLLKELTIETLEKIDGHWTPRRQVMRNVQDDQTSRLDTVEVEYNAPLGDEVFHQAHLGR